MLSAFARDLADPDRPIEDAAAERPGKPIRVRIQPSVFRLNGGSGPRSAGQYRAWRDVHWTLECATPAEAFALRDTLRSFFDVLSTHGPAVVQAALDASVESTPRPREQEPVP